MKIPIVKGFLVTVNSRLADTSLLRTLAIMNKFQIPGKSYRGLTENDSRFLRTLAIAELRTLSWYQSDNFIVLTLDKADTLYYSYNIVM